MEFFRNATAALAVLGLAACGTSLDRTLFGPNLPDNTRGAEIAREKDYPNVFTGEEQRQPLMTPEEQEAAKKRLERARAAQRK